MIEHAHLFRNKWFCGLHDSRTLGRNSTNIDIIARAITITITISTPSRSIYNRFSRIIFHVMIHIRGEISTYVVYYLWTSYYYKYIFLEYFQESLILWVYYIQNWIKSSVNNVYMMYTADVISHENEHVINSHIHYKQNEHITGISLSCYSA